MCNTACRYVLTLTREDTVEKIRPFFYHCADYRHVSNVDVGGCHYRVYRGYLAWSGTAYCGSTVRRVLVCCGGGSGYARNVSHVLAVLVAGGGVFARVSSDC